jgi:hypothetical protein
MLGRITVGGLVVLCAAVAYGQENSTEQAIVAPSSTAQVIYKGLVGNLLDSVPLDSDNRLQLQRLNALVSSPLGARSLALALGIASPPLLIVGVIWGLWSASNIEAQPRAERAASAPQLGARVAFDGQQIARGDGTLALQNKYVAANELAGMVGGAAASGPVAPCESCVMPMLYSRALPPAR